MLIYASTGLLYVLSNTVAYCAQASVLTLSLLQLLLLLVPLPITVLLTGASASAVIH
jgi:hypothetical protein